MFTANFLRTLVLINGAVPLAFLLWDAYHRQIGANSVNAALHITGTLALIFLVLSLAITPLRKLTRSGVWLASRRALGLYAFFYAVLHLVIYVTFDRELDLRSTFVEFGLRTYLQVGGISLLLMIPLAATSTNTMIRKMGAKRWQVLHRLAYPIGILAVIHFYMSVKSDVREPMAFGVVMLGLLAMRLLPQSKARTKPVVKSS